MKLRDKTAFITGGASGIGLAMAETFGREGMNVVLADIAVAPLHAAVTKLRALGIEVEGVRTDVTDRASMIAAAGRAVAWFGNVHLVCNNAGVAVTGALGTTPPDDWDWLIDVNIKGVLNGMEVFVPMIERQGEGGHFVNTASLAGMVGAPGSEVYSGTKFAVVGMSEGWAKQLAPKGIGLTILLPGLVDTNIYNSRRSRPALHGSDAQQAKLAKVHADVADKAVAAAIKGGAIPDLAKVGISPRTVGRMVLEAVRNDELYVITHPDFRPLVETRFKAILSGFERSAEAEIRLKHTREAD